MLHWKENEYPETYGILWTGGGDGGDVEFILG